MRKFHLLICATLISAPAWAQDAGLVFTALDKNKDGRVSQEEADANAVVKDLFQQADTNKDGALAREEFLAAFGKSG